LRFSEYFPVIYGFGLAIHIRIHHLFHFLRGLASGLPMLTRGPLSAKCTFGSNP